MTTSSNYPATPMPAPPPSPSPPQRQIVTVRLDQLAFSPLNPRTNAEAELEELIRSLGDGPAPDLAQLPTGELLPDGRVRLLSGERRVRAIIQSGRWQTVEMVVVPASALSAVQKHRHRLNENLHRRDLDEFDEAAALKVSYILANAEALGATTQAEMVLTRCEDAGKILSYALQELEQMLKQLTGWSPTRPPVSWDEVLDKLGIALEPSRRIQKLRVLKVAISVQERLKALSRAGIVRLSEVALRELGRLEERDQAALVAALEQSSQPQTRELAEKVVAIVKYFLDEQRQGQGQASSIEQAIAHVLAYQSQPQPRPEQSAERSGTGGGRSDLLPLAQPPQQSQVAYPTPTATPSVDLEQSMVAPTTQSLQPLAATMLSGYSATPPATLQAPALPPSAPNALSAPNYAGEDEDDYEGGEYDEDADEGSELEPGSPVSLDGLGLPAELSQTLIVLPQVTPTMLSRLAKLEPAVRYQLAQALVDNPQFEARTIYRFISQLTKRVGFEEALQEALGLKVNNLYVDQRTTEQKLAEAVNRVLDGVAALTEGLDLIKLALPHLFDQGQEQTDYEEEWEQEEEDNDFEGLSPYQRLPAPHSEQLTEILGYARLALAQWGLL